MRLITARVKDSHAEALCVALHLQDGAPAAWGRHGAVRAEGGMGCEDCLSAFDYTPIATNLPLPELSFATGIKHAAAAVAHRRACTTPVVASQANQPLASASVAVAPSNTAWIYQRDTT